MSFTRSIKLATLALLLASSVFSQQVRIPGPGGSTTAPASGTWTIRDHQASNGSSVTVNTVTGDLIVLAYGAISGLDPTCPGTGSDTIGNSYTLIGVLASLRGGGSGLCIYIAKSTGTNASNMVALSGGTNPEDISALTATNSAGSTYALDGSACTSTSASSCSVTTSMDNALLVGVSDISNSNTLGSGFTDFGQGAPASGVCNTASTIRYCSEFKITSTTGSNSISFTAGSTVQGILGVAIKYQ